MSGEQWVHLRVCLTCGHVGRCDSSRNQHARGHAAQDSHPLIASGHERDTRAYCFLVQLTVDVMPGPDHA